MTMLAECFHMASQVTGACCDVGWYLHLDAGARERDAGMARGIMPLRMTIDGWQFVFPGFFQMQGIIQREMSISDPGKMEISCIVAAPSVEVLCLS